MAVPKGFEPVPQPPAGFVVEASDLPPGFEQTPEGPPPGFEIGTSTSLTRIADAALSGAVEGFGEGEIGLDLETIGNLQDIGLFAKNPLGRINQAVAVPAVGVLDTAVRSGEAVLSGFASAAGQTARELGAGSGMSKRLERDIRLAIDSALLVGGITPPSALRGGMRRRVTQERESALRQIREAEEAGDIAAPASDPRLAGNINLDRIEAPDDVKNIIIETAETGEGFMKARRAPMSFEQIEGLAGDLGMSSEALIRRGVGEAFNAEQAVAARNLLVQSATDLQAKSRKALGGSDDDVLAFQEALTKHVAIQEQVSGLTAEAGRALASFKITATGEARQRAIKDIVETAGGRERAEEIAARISSLDNPEELARYSRDIVKPTLKDKAFEVWINSLLSGPQTQAVNFLSNSLVSLWRVPERATAAAISAARGAPPQERVFLSEAGAKAMGIVEGIVEGAPAGVRAFRTEIPGEALTKLEVARTPSIGGTTGRIVRIPGRTLQATDEFFKAIGYRQELNALAIRQGRSEGLNGRQLAERIDELRRNPTEKMIETATDAAREQTFTRPLGPLGSQITSAIDKTPGGRIIVPFIRTPTNIVKFAVERSPFAPLMKDVRDNLRAGGIRRDEQLGRISMGSAISTWAAYYAAQGRISGGGPTDPNERRVWLQDNQPYSVKIGDEWHAYGRLEPLGILLGAAADFADIRDRMNDEDSSNVASLIVAAAARNLTSKTWLRGISELNRAFEDPDRYGERFVQNLAGTAVPTGVAQVESVMDPTWREVYSITDKLRSRVPGISQELFPRRDIWGEPITAEGGVGPDILSPIKLKTDRQDKVNSEMLRLKVFPSKIPRKIGGVELTPVQFDEFQLIAGTVAKSALDQIVEQPQYDALPSIAQEKMIRRVISQAREEARNQVVMRHPELVRQRVQTILDETLN